MDIGDSVGGIYKKSKNGEEFWELVEDKIIKITITRRYGRRYFTKSNFFPLDADDVDSTTKMMEEAVNKGYIITREIFGLNEITRPFAENWIKWANANIDKAVSALSSEVQ
jgi:threonyl-tRNA synthetase